MRSTHTNWADIDFEDENNDTEGLIAYDENGNKVITTYYREGDGRQMKCERTLCLHKRIVKLPVAVRQRETSLKKFGLESLDLKKPEYKKFGTSSSTRDEILRGPERFGLLGQDVFESESKIEIPKKAMSDIQRFFSYVSAADPRGVLAAAAIEYDETQPMPMPGTQGGDTEDKTIRVTNLPEYVDEDTLRKLFSRCGNFNRFFLARNRETMVSKGFAFVTYNTRAEAETAIRLLHKHGFQNVLLNVEWAKRKTAE